MGRKLNHYLHYLTVILVGLALNGCDWMIYVSSPAVEHDPKEFGVQAEDVWFQSEGEEALHGWYFRGNARNRPRAVFFYFHGNGGNVATHFPHLVWLLQHGYDFFVFDYRGFGKSLGTPSPEATVADGKAAHRYLKSRMPDVPWVVFAQSLGSAIGLKTLIELKGETELALIVVDSGFSSYRKIGESILEKYGLPKLFRFLLPNDDFAPDGEIDRLSPSPLLVIHGDRDSLVDFRFGTDLFESAGFPKNFWRIPDGEHTDVFLRQDDSYRSKFLNHLISLGL